MWKVWWIRLLQQLRCAMKRTKPRSDSRAATPEPAVGGRTEVLPPRRPFWLSETSVEPPPKGAPRPPGTLPPGYRLLNGEGPEFFDPALRHYRCAFRRAEPVFDSDEDRRRWLAARQRVIDHVLGIVSGSSWRQRLVLRGSALLRTQLGAAARAPGDIDWVVLPAGLPADSPSGREIIDDIARLVGQRAHVDDITIDVGRPSIGAIWTYERAEGRRLTFAWSVPGLPPGTVQQDFVYGETLDEPAEETAVALGDGSTVELLAATPALSLCWKLLWLGSDSLPQGKDLYDAVLLAEAVRLPPGMLEQVVTRAMAKADLYPMPLPLEIDEWSVDWRNFRLEYPDVDGELEDWKRRLAVALARQSN
jgi:hypothetical protein